MDIPSQLRLMRGVRGLTLAQVADGTGLSISYLSDLERGRTNPSIETLEKIATFHNMQLYISFVGDMPGTVRISRCDLENLRDTIARLLDTAPQHESGVYGLPVEIDHD